MKAAIVVLSDPKPGSEESLGRVFNALAAAYDFKQKGDEVSILSIAIYGSAQESE
jgi:hypothetical protein